MGVPKFFRYISERYPCLGELIRDHQIPDFDNLYLDMNGIIHVCSHPNDFDPHFRITEEKIFSDIFHYLELLFGMIKPKRLFFMAIDGVAPRAKMNQQRGRRFRSAKEAEMLEKKAKDMGQELPASARFDSNCITPGTVFMVKLHEQLKYFITKKISEDPLWQRCTVILSGHETPGEGEHKIMDYIRFMKSQPDYDHNTRHCLYGLDADLVMLGLCSHEPHFSLLREEVKFGRQAKRQTAAQGVRFFLLHLSLMREYLDLEFRSVKSTLPFPYDLESIIDDWVLLSFLVGNDFIPNVPGMHIANGALPVLYNAYKEVLPTLDGYINEHGNLNLARFRKFMEKLAAFDISQFKETYADLKYFEGKTGRKMTTKLKPFEMGDGDEKEENSAVSKNRDLADLIKATDDLYNDEALEEAEEDIFQEVDYDYSDDSEDDDPAAFITEFHQHKKNYYIEKMEYDKVTADVLSGQAEGYVRAIQWNLHYYYHGVASWSWYYPHHYAPYLSDICRFKDMELTFDLGKPFHPFEQLLGVLPAASKSLLPEPYRWLMTEPTSPIIEYYPEDFRTDLNGKAQDWEAVVLIPFIAEDRLLSAMAPCYEKLSPEEKARNEFGPMLIYNHTDESSGLYKAPEYFPSVRNNLTKVDKLWYNDVQLERSKLIQGLLPGAKTIIYFPGFPTLQHIPFETKLKKANVAVFETMNRNESMILTFTEGWLQGLPNLEQVAKEYLGKDVYIDYPHLHEARVVAVANKDERYDLDPESRTQTFTKKELKEMESHQVVAEGEVIKNEYLRKRGIDVGKTHVVVYACSVEGERGVLRNGQLVFEKQYVNSSSPYALQAIVKDIPVYEPKEKIWTMDEVFSPGSACFMLGQPYYGSCGKVLDANDIKPGRIKVEMILEEQPNFDPVQKKLKATDVYYSANQASHHIGINTLLLTRITGTILLKAEGKEKEIQHNIGMNLKSTKQSLMVPGYTRRNNGVWLYSTLVFKDLQEYMDKFPDLFEKLSNSAGIDLKLSDVFPGPEGSKQISALKKFLNDLPCAKVERASCNSEIVPAHIVEETEKTIDAFVKSRRSNKTGILQVKPTALYKSKLASGNLSPDPNADHRLFDRVIIVRDDFIVPMKLKGTIIGIHRSEKPNENRYDVLFDETFPGAVSISNSSKRAFRVAQSKFLNITHGMRKSGNISASQGKVAAANDINSKRPSAFTSFNANKQPYTDNTPQNWRQAPREPSGNFQKQKNGPTQEPKAILSRDPSSNALLRGPEWMKPPPPVNVQPSQAAQNKYPDVWALLQSSKQPASSEEAKAFAVPPPASALPVPLAAKQDDLSTNNSEDRIRVANKSAEYQLSSALMQMLRIGSVPPKGPRKEPPRAHRPQSKPVLVSDMMAAAARAAKEAAASCSVTPSRESLRPDKPSAAQQPAKQPSAVAAAPPPFAPALTAHSSAQSLNEILSLFQSKGEGVPHFSFTETSGNQVQANVVLPDQRTVTSATCKDKREAVESAASAALTLLKQEKPKEEMLAGSSVGSEQPQQRKAAEENPPLHPLTLFQHFRTNAHNQKPGTLPPPPGNMHPNQPLPIRFPPSMPFPVSPSKSNSWRAPPQNAFIHRPHPQRQDGSMPRNMSPFDMNFLRGAPPPPFGFNQAPFAPHGNWQPMRPYQQRHQQQHQQPLHRPPQQHWQPPLLQQQQPPVPQQQPQATMEKQAAPKKSEGVLAFVPLQSVKQQRNAKSAALLRQEHLTNQAGPTAGAASEPAPAPPVKAQQDNQKAPADSKQQQPLSQKTSSKEENADTKEREVKKPVANALSGHAIPKKQESDDRKVGSSEQPSRPMSQVRRNRLAARFGPTT